MRRSHTFVGSSKWLWARVSAGAMGRGSARTVIGVSTRGNPECVLLRCVRNENLNGCTCQLPRVSLPLSACIKSRTAGWDLMALSLGEFS
jgi:hypothetical protein